MSDFLNQQIPPPENWQDFEKLCADLWTRILGEPNTQMNGRQGQAQHGVDVFGRLGGSGDWQGVQCKGKDGRYGHPVTEKELKAEVKKAKKFTPKITAFILATTAPNDTSIQEVARKITEKHKAKNLFSVDVLGWGEIQRRLADYPDLIDKHFPGHGPGLNRIEDGIKKLLEQQVLSDERQDQRNRELSQSSTEITEQLEPFLIEVRNLLDVARDGAQLPGEEAVNAQIDDYRDLLLKSQPATALKLLVQLKSRHWGKVSEWVKFRILTNISASHLALGDKQTASDGFLEAEQYAPHDEKAACNVAMAHLLIENDREALSAAKRATEAHPTSARAFSLLVASSITDQKVGTPEDIVPSEFLEDGQVAYAIANFYRVRGNTDEATKWINKAYTLDESHLEVRSNYGTTLLERVANDQSATVGEQRDESQESALNEAVEILRGVWGELKDTEIAFSNLHIAQNLISAERLLKNFDDALAVANDALRIDQDSVDLRRQKAVLLLESDDPKGACAALSDIPENESLKVALLYAEALSQAGRHEDALGQVERYLGEVKEGEQVAVAAGQRLLMLHRASGSRAALNAISETISDFPDSIVVHIHVAQLLTECGDDDAAAKHLETAVHLTGPDTEYGERLAIADEVFRLGDYQEAANLYKNLVSSFGNSKPLRRLLVCYIESDRRKDALDLLDKIPDEIRQLNFYRRLAAAIYIRIGKIAEARHEMEEYLKVEPNDLHIWLNWIGILLRQNERQRVEEFLSETTDYPNASPEDRMHLAHLFDHFNHSEKALNLAYAIRIAHPENATIHLGYIGFFTVGKAVNTLKEPTEVASDTAFIAKDVNGDQISHFISENPESGALDGCIAPEHPYAKAAIGKKVGDTITIKRNPYQSDDYELVEIKSKFLHVFHETTANFATQFPSNRSFMTVSVANPDGDGYSFDAIYQSLTERQEHVLETLDMYRSQPYTIGIVSRLLGVHPIDVWRGIKVDPKVQIFCCDGTEAERNQALALLSVKGQGFVADPLFLDSIYTLGVHEAVLETLGSLGITQSTLDMYGALIEDRKLHSGKDGHHHMSKQGDEYVMQEITAEEVEENIRQLEEIRDWAEKNCEVLPAIPATEPPMLAHEFSRLADPAFMDSVLAASGSERVLLSDDQRLRLIAKELSGVDGVWLQVVLLEAVNRDLLPFGRYSEVVANMIEFRIEFTTITSRVMHQIAESETWEMTNRFKAVMSTIGGENADLISAFRVVAGFLPLLWENAPAKNRQNLTTGLIDALTENHFSKAPAFMNALVRLNVKLPETVRKSYLSTLKKWCSDHSISMPSPALDRLRQFKSYLLGTTSLSSPYLAR